MTIRAILVGRSGAIHTAEAGESVAAVVQRLTEQRIGAVPVVENGAVVGIFSERDVIHCLNLHRSAALDLVVRGHRLVADDIVHIRRRGEKGTAIIGSGSGIIRHHMEIRGLGIINIKDLFGVAAIREAKKLELVVELVEWDANEEYDRLGLDEKRYTVLDVEVPMVRLPVRPGRNLATIIEVAARNQLLKLQGHHSAREFQERLNRAIAEARPKAAFDVDVIE